MRRPIAAISCLLVSLLLGCQDAPREAEAPTPPKPRGSSRIIEQLRAFEETKGNGLWAEAPSDETLEERRKRAERLFALGYLDGMQPAPEGPVSVTVHDPTRAWNGLNLYVAGHAEEANLLDMTGRVLHRWHFELDSLEHAKTLPENRMRFLRHAALYPDGSLLALYDYQALVKMDERSNLQWVFWGGPHHDFEVQPNGDIFALTATRRRYKPWSPTSMVTDCYVSRLDPHGIERDRVSLIEAIHKSGMLGLWRLLVAERETAIGRIGDVLHANSVQVVDGRLADRLPAFQAGRVLVSLPVIHTVVLVDMDTKRVVWSLQGTFRFQHDARLLPTGRLLLFDNQRGPDERSAVLEIDLASRKTTWAYRGTPDRPFFSWCCGMNHRLPNGNTLIVETEAGRAIEVTPENDVVWEFVNPNRAGEKHDLIAQLFDVVRIDPAEHAAWLPEAASLPNGPLARPASAP